jgi:hypothetical protein
MLSTTSSAGWIHGLLCLLLAGSLPGCESVGRSGAESKSAAEIEEVHRAKYQETRSAAALRWLVMHRLENGMTQEQIDRIFGEEGAREYNDQQFKGRGGPYRVDDEMYRYGPDDKGQVYYLGFRDGHLVNFNPREYDGMKELNRDSPNL